MAFSINTNIASLQAQNYLQKSSQFQSQTINQVTSGLRIVNSGDDAAGLVGVVPSGVRDDRVEDLPPNRQHGSKAYPALRHAGGGRRHTAGRSAK